MKVCQAASKQPELALDTEFIRVRSYYPHVALIQLGYGDEVALIDPLVITDWLPLVDLLRCPEVMKFLHAGGEDLEVFHYHFGVTPEPFLDTQILAAFTGNNLSIGLATLVAQYAGVVLDKSEALTDWLARPLTSEQCAYASADVAYLLPVARQLSAQVQQAGWLAAVEEECRLMQTRRCAVPQPQEAWRDIGNYGKLRSCQFACLQLLAAWRLEQAQQRDLALNFVLRGEKLWRIARYLPAGATELVALGLSGGEIRRYGAALLELVAKSQRLPATSLPASAANPVQIPGFNQLFREIKTRVEQIASQHDLIPGLLASRRQITQLLSWHWQLSSTSQTPELFSGWRASLLLRPLQELLVQYPDTQYRAENLSK